MDFSARGMRYCDYGPVSVPLCCGDHSELISLASSLHSICLENFINTYIQAAVILRLIICRRSAYNFAINVANVVGMNGSQSRR